MDLSPNDIRTQEFQTQMRGYSKDDVDTFLDEVATAMELQKQENLKLSMEIDSLKTQLAGLKQFEDSIKGAAIDARRNADATIENAKKEAEEMLTRAKTDSEELMNSKEKRLAEIDKQISKVEVTKTSYLTRMKTLIESHLEIIREIMEEENVPADAAPTNVESTNDVEVTAAEEIDGSNRETIANEPPVETEEPKITEDANSEHLIDNKQSQQEVDPELKQAMAGYGQSESETPVDANPLEGFKETTARAEDIPPGFITKEENEAGSIPAENRPKGVDAILDHKPADKDKIDAPVNPDELANELDAVVAKFEEEMDKAQQT